MKTHNSIEEEITPPKLVSKTRSIIGTIVVIAQIAFFIIFFALKLEGWHIIWVVIPMLLIPFTVSSEIERNDRIYNENDEFVTKRNEKILFPFKKALNTAPESPVARHGGNTAPNHTHENKKQEVPLLNASMVCNHEFVLILKYIGLTTAPLLFSLPIIFESENGIVSPTKIQLTVFMVLFIPTIILLFYIIRNRSFSITVNKGFIKLSNGIKFHLSSIKQVKMVEPVFISYHKISFSIIKYRTKKNSLGHLIIFNDLTNYDKLIDLFYSAMKVYT